MSYLEDMARSLVILGERPEADGKVWHLPATDPITGRQFLELVFAEVGSPPKVARLSPGMARLGGVFVPMIRELGELMYQWTAPFVLDASKFRGSFGPFQPTPHPEAVMRTPGSASTRVLPVGEYLVRYRTVSPKPGLAHWV
jgi:nucleoside-diphosphate-sugar epimerase